MDYKTEPIKKEMWKCPRCGCPRDTEREAYTCLYNHIKEICINNDLNHGLSLGYINYAYAMNWTLTDTQKEITKDNCFVISYLQCCDRPAYRITYISYSGKITVGGCGSWSGYYSSSVGLHCLQEPWPKEELFIDERAK